MNKILQEDFDLAPCMVAGYESFGNGLLNIAFRADLVAWVNRSSRMCWFCVKITHWFFWSLFDETYTRIISAGIRNPVGRLSMSWKKGNRTAIHAHPSICWLHVCRWGVLSWGFWTFLKRGFVWFKRWQLAIFTGYMLSVRLVNSTIIFTGLPV